MQLHSNILSITRTGFPSIKSNSSLVVIIRMYIFCSPCQWKINKHQKTYNNYFIIASVYSRSIVPDLRDYINETYFSRLVHDFSCRTLPFSHACFQKSFISMCFVFALFYISPYSFQFVLLLMFVWFHCNVKYEINGHKSIEDFSKQNVNW
jgi:hypothetical protein